jgi:hypothetical protein
VIEQSIFYASNEAAYGLIASDRLGRTPCFGQYRKYPQNFTP